MYTHSCDGYAGFCSNTNHQMKIVCTVAGNQLVCGLQRPAGVDGAGHDPAVIGGRLSLWNGFEPENSLSAIRAHLNAGRPVMLGIEVD